MSRVDISVDMSELQGELSKIGDRVDLALPIIGEVLVTAIDELIQSEGAAGTEGEWEPFSPVTFKIHPRREGGKLLQDTGELANMQTEIGPDFVEVFSPAPYAGYQMDGVDPNPIPEFGPIPARDPFAIDLDDVLGEACQLIEEVIAE